MRGVQNGGGLERGSPGATLEAQPFPQTPPGMNASGVVGSGGSVGSLTPAQVQTLVLLHPYLTNLPTSVDAYFIPLALRCHLSF